ncbi:MAG: hypothetical protein JSV01_06890 [Desulfobacterales bacterium]|nr:MAG: hypothetical protein JSV01_06890 [Desulfobacterales bacterium]
MGKALIGETEETMPAVKLLTECKRFKPGVGFTCKAKDIGLDAFVQCLEEDSFRCPFSVRYSHSYFCRSAARVYAAKLKR